MQFPRSYTFFPVESCVMCGAPASQFKVMGRRLDRSQGRRPTRVNGVASTVMQCRNCSLIFSNPQPIPFDINDHYGVDPKSYWKESYFDFDPEQYFSGERKRLKQLMKVKSGMRYLDIGAGIGKQMSVMRTEGFDVYGLEPSSAFREMAIEKTGISEDRLQLASVETAEYPENHFDFASFGAVLEHLYNPAFCIEQAMRWLKPGGLLHVEVPSSEWFIHSLINGYYRYISRKDYVGNLSPMHAPYHLFEFSVKSFREHAKKAGYSMAYSEFYVADTLMPAWLEPILTAYMKRTGTGMQLAVWLQKN